MKIMLQPSSNIPKLKRPNVTATYLKGDASPYRSDWTNSCVVTDDGKYMLYGVLDQDLKNELDHSRERNIKAMDFKAPDFTMRLIVYTGANGDFSDRHHPNYKDTYTVTSIKSIEGDFKAKSVEDLVEIFGTIAVCLERNVKLPKRTWTQENFDKIRNIARIRLQDTPAQILSPKILSELGSYMTEDRRQKTEVRMQQSFHHGKESWRERPIQKLRSKIKSSCTV